MDERRRRAAQSRRPAARPAATQTRSRTQTATRSKAQTAQRRNEQTARKPAAKKKQKVRYRNKNLKYQLLTVAAVVLAVILCLVIFFRVRHINVTNLGQERLLSQQTDGEAEPGGRHSYYTADDIIAVSGIETGDNLLTISKEGVAARIMAALPYVSEVYIRRVIPGTVNITVSEFEVSYAIEDTNGSWWLINRDGKTLESTTAEAAKSHIVIAGLRIVPPEKPGVSIEPEQAEDMAEQEAKKTSMVSILQTLEAHEYRKQIVTLDLTSSYDIQLWYGTQYQIRIGNTENLSYKLSYLESVLEKLQSFQTGVIDLTFTESQEARFQPFS